MIKVLIVDDHFVVRKGIHAVLAQTTDIAVVGEAVDGQEAVDKAFGLKPDVVLMDLLMPRMDGVEAIRRILDSQPRGVRVLVLTGFNVADDIFAAIRAGALGYLAKTSSEEDLLRAIRRVHRGEPWLPPRATRKLLRELAPKDDAIGSLTGREIEILRLVATGLSNQSIAERAGISEVTVRTHVSHVLAKLGLKNRVEATLFALRNGLASLEEENEAPR